MANCRMFFLVSDIVLMTKYIRKLESERERERRKEQVREKAGLVLKVCEKIEKATVPV